MESVHLKLWPKRKKYKYIHSNCYKDSFAGQISARYRFKKNKTQKASNSRQVDKLQLLEADLLLPHSLGPASRREVGSQEERDKAKQVP